MFVKLWCPSFVAGKWAAEPHECRGDRTAGPNSWRERRGLCENQRAFLCQPGMQKITKLLNLFEEKKAEQF